MNHKSNQPAEESIPEKTRTHSETEGEKVKVVGIDIFIDCNDKSVRNLLNTPFSRDPERQLADIVDALQRECFDILWCTEGLQFHIVLPEGQVKEACRIIQTALTESWPFHNHGPLVKFETTSEVRGIPSCQMEDCDLTALYLSDLEGKLSRLAERQNAKRAARLNPNLGTQPHTNNMV